MHALRAQTDKVEYAQEMRRILEETPNLFLREGMAVGLDLGPNNEVQGVKTFFGLSFRCRAAVVTTGTFMNGRIWVGRQSMPAGRYTTYASMCITMHAHYAQHASSLQLLRIIEAESLGCYAACQGTLWLDRYTCKECSRCHGAVTVGAKEAVSHGPAQCKLHALYLSHSCPTTIRNSLNIISKALL